jgi:inhibin beta
MLRRCRTFRWLWLVFLSVAMVTGADCTERHHQHHHHYKHQHPHPHPHQDTRHSAQPELQLLPSSQLDRIPPLPSDCPNCIQLDQKRERTQQRNSDEIRLETIKRQILSKLGLKEKPTITAPVPREIIMETLYRAEETGDQQDGSGSDGRIMEDVSAGPVSTRAPESEPDDFYGRTSEIIAFAEPGKNHRRPHNAQGVEMRYFLILAHRRELMSPNDILLCFKYSLRCTRGRGN